MTVAGSMIYLKVTARRSGLGFRSSRVNSDKVSSKAREPIENWANISTEACSLLAALTG